MLLHHSHAYKSCSIDTLSTATSFTRKSSHSVVCHNRRQRGVLVHQKPPILSNHHNTSFSPPLTRHNSRSTPHSRYKNIWVAYHYNNPTTGDPQIADIHREFQSIDELRQIAEDQPRPERHDVLLRNQDTDETQHFPYRDSLWIEDNGIGDVTANRDWYNIVGYDEILGAVTDKIEREDLNPHGDFSRRKNHSKMNTRIYLNNEETTIEPRDGDKTQLGIDITAGHTGFTGINYDLGGLREICSNGMKGWVSDLNIYQDHTEEFRPELAHHAVDALIEGADTYEQRLKDAQNQELMNLDEALILLQETGIGQYFDNPTADLLNAAHTEIEDQDNPTVYEVFQAGTRALEHYSDAPQHEKQHGYDQLSQLLDQDGEMPDINEYAADVVNNRMNEYAVNEEVEPYWETEKDALHELAELRA